MILTLRTVKQDHGNNLLHVALRVDAPHRVVSRLLKKGKFSMQTCKPDPGKTIGFTPIHMSILFSSHPKVIRDLIAEACKEDKAILNARDSVSWLHRDNLIGY